MGQGSYVRTGLGADTQGRLAVVGRGSDPPTTIGATHGPTDILRGFGDDTAEAVRTVRAPYPAAGSGDA